MKIKKFNENLEEKKLQKVKVLTDGDGHWFIVPYLIFNDFYKDLENEDMVDSGDFDSKWGKYQTGGDLNLVQLWAEI